MQRKTFSDVNTTNTSYLPDNSIEERPSKNPKTMTNTDFGFLLPDELWLLILQYVHPSFPQNSSLHFFPHYALVNKRFYGFFHYFVNLNVALNHSLSFIMHTLIGKTTFENYLKEKKHLRSIFLIVFNKAISIAEKIDFNHLTLILKKTFCQAYPKFLDFTFIQSYEGNYRFEISCVDKPLLSNSLTPDNMKNPFFVSTHFQMHTYNIEAEDLRPNEAFESKIITKSEILDELFKLNTDIKNDLNLLTQNSDCHAALLALAYFISLQNNRQHFIHLGILFAEMGLLRGTLFILEMCELYNIWLYDTTFSSSQSNKNRLLKNLVYEALQDNEMGEDIVCYIMNRFEFHYTAKFVYEIIDNIRRASSYLPIHLLALDCRHYSSADEFLKFFQIAYQMIQNYRTKNPHEFSEEQKLVLSSINFPVPSSISDIIAQDTDLPAIEKNLDFFKDELIHCLANFRDILLSHLETLDLSKMINQFVTAAQKRNINSEMIEKESIGDLQGFLGNSHFTQNQNNGKAMIEEVLSLINLEKAQLSSNATIHQM